MLSVPQYSYSSLVEEYNALVYVKRRDTFHVDSAPYLRGKLDKDGLCLCFPAKTYTAKNIHPPTHTTIRKAIAPTLCLSLCLCLFLSLCICICLVLSLSLCLSLSLSLYLSCSLGLCLFPLSLPKRFSDTLPAEHVYLCTFKPCSVTSQRDQCCLTLQCNITERPALSHPAV